MNPNGVVCALKVWGAGCPSLQPAPARFGGISGPWPPAPGPRARRLRGRESEAACYSKRRAKQIRNDANAPVIARLHITRDHIHDRRVGSPNDFRRRAGGERTTTPRSGDTEVGQHNAEGHVGAALLLEEAELPAGACGARAQGRLHAAMRLGRGQQRAEGGRHTARACRGCAPVTTAR